MDLELGIGEDAEKDVVKAAPFYVVSLQKLVLLQVMTFGFYGIVWFYWHFRRQKEFYRDDSWPVMRSIFSIFFTHTLFNEIADKDRKTGAPLVWNPAVLASIVVLMNLAMSVLNSIERLGGVVPYSMFSPFLLLPVEAYCLSKAQAAANHVCGDPSGATNNGLDWVNYVFLVPGAIFMLLYLLGILVMVGSGEPL